MATALRTFISYSHKDQDLREAVVEHLALLRHDGTLSVWTDRAIKAGDEFDEVIAAKLREADLVLLLVSAAFVNSTYCFGKEMTVALARHHMGQCRVVPIILRPCDWKTAPFAALGALPTDGKPVTDRRFWHDDDEALADVAVSLRKTLAQPPAAADGWPDESMTGKEAAADRAVEAVATAVMNTARRAAGSTLATADTFRDVVVPLMKEFDGLHAMYLDSFRRCRRILELRGDTLQGFLDAVDRLNSDTLFRSSQLTRVQLLSGTSTAPADAPFLTAVADYLTAPSKHLHLANICLVGSSSSLRTNWYGLGASKSLSNVLEDPDPAVRKARALGVVDTFVETLQQYYADVFSAYHAVAEASRRSAGSEPS